MFEFNKIANLMDLPEIVRNESINIYEYCKKKKLTRGRKKSIFIAACILIASKEVGYPINIKKLANVAETKIKDIIRNEKFIKRFLNYKIRIAPENYLFKYANDLNLTEHEKSKALKILEKIKNLNKRPESLAAISIYLAGLSSLRKIAKISGLSKNHIWESSKMIKLKMKNASK